MALSDMSDMSHEWCIGQSGMEALVHVVPDAEPHNTMLSWYMETGLLRGALYTIMIAKRNTKQ